MITITDLNFLVWYMILMYQRGRCDWIAGVGRWLKRKGELASPMVQNGRTLNIYEDEFSFPSLNPNNPGRCFYP